jgi:hypothetical protein
MMKTSGINVKAMALSLGVLWGGSVLLTGILAMRGFGAGFVNALGTVYPGYSATFPGSIIGGVYGFVEGCIGGALLAWLYNHFSQK